MLKKIMVMIMALLLPAGMQTGFVAANTIGTAQGMQLRVADSETEEFKVRGIWVADYREGEEQLLNRTEQAEKYVVVMFNKPIRTAENENADALNPAHYTVEGNTAVSVTPLGVREDDENTVLAAVVVEFQKQVPYNTVFQISEFVTSASGELLSGIGGREFALPYAELDNGAGSSGYVSAQPLSVDGPQDYHFENGMMGLISFHVLASGGDPSQYAYRWYYSPTKTGAGQLVQDDQIKGQYTDQLMVSLESITDAVLEGYYYCIVTDGTSVVESRRARLTIDEQKQKITCGTDKLKDGKAKIECGTAFHLSAESGVPGTLHMPGGKLTYQSSDKKVVSVNENGKVTAKGCGNAVITIRAAATKRFAAVSKKVKLTVIPKRVAITKEPQITAGPDGKVRVHLEWKPDNTVDGYEYFYTVFYSDSESKDIHREWERNTITISRPDNAKRMKIKIRSYKKTGGKTYYGPWSYVREIKL